MRVIFMTFLNYLCIANLFSTLEGCLLCPERIPSRPKPLDQFRLPSIQKLMDTTDAVVQLCNNDTRLSTVSDECRTDVSHLFCSLTSMVEYFKSECPTGSDDFEGCASCQKNNADIYYNNSWIITWIDSIGKMPYGISDGNYHWLGDYEQCRYLKDHDLFNGRYCSIQFDVPDTLANIECDANQPLKVHLGICLPAGCTTTELDELAEFAADHEMDIYCEPRQEWKISTKIFLGSTILWVIIILLASTVHSLTWNYENSKFKLLVEALSLQNNVRGCLRTKNHSTHFQAVHGLQVFSLVLLIFGSNFFLIMPYLENVGFAYQSAESFYLQPIVNYSFYVDGLLALGAMKLVLKPIQEFKTIKSLWGHGKRRLLRFWPAYAFVTAFMTLLYVRLGEGPMWSLNDLPRRCKTSWWANLLLVNNLLGISETCLDGGFLFALEAQFLIVALLALYFVNKNKTVARLSLIGILLLSLIYSFGVSYYYGTFATLIPTARDFNSTEAYTNFVNKIYLNPIARIGPYIIGLMFPLFFRCSKDECKSSPLLNWAIFILFLIGTFGVIWTPYLLDSSHLFRLFSLYAAAHRCVWAVMVLSLTYVLNNISKKNVINAILSWRIFYPMSKLVYVVFLLSEPVALSLFSSLHRPICATHFSTMLTGVGTIVTSYFLAFLVDVIISRPIRHLCSVFHTPQPVPV